MSDEEPVEVELSAYLQDLEPEQFNIRVPLPVGHRADQLVQELLERARALGSVARGELVAALIHDAPSDAAELRGMIERYREARVWETLIGTSRKTGTVVIERRGRGRPRRSRSG